MRITPECRGLCQIFESLTNEGYPDCFSLVTVWAGDARTVAGLRPWYQKHELQPRVMAMPDGFFLHRLTEALCYTA